MTNFDYANANRSDVTIVTARSGDGAAVYYEGKLVDQGHTSDVYERIIEEFFDVEHNFGFTVDPDARGWSGTAQTLEELGL